MSKWRVALGALIGVVVLTILTLVLRAVEEPADPYEAAWDNCIATAEANPPADDEFPIPPDELCQIHENDVGREQFIIDFGE